MSKEAENIISLINKGALPPINRDEVFGINTFILSSSNKSKIKEQAYKEFAEKLENEINMTKSLSIEQDKSIIHMMHKLLKEMIDK